MCCQSEAEKIVVTLTLPVISLTGTINGEPAVWTGCSRLSLRAQSAWMARFARSDSDPVSLKLSIQPRFSAAPVSLTVDLPAKGGRT
jgi:hypothetical protein